MPQPFKNAVITNAGAALLTRAQAGEVKIEFLKVIIGNGEYEEAEKDIWALQERTGLKSEKNGYGISNISIYDDKTVQMECLISNQDIHTEQALITEGYYINEIGIYAKAAGTEDDTAVLYSIAVVSGDTGDYMPAYNGYNPAQIIQKFYISVSNSADVLLRVSNGAVALAQDVQNIKVQMESIGFSYEQDTKTLIWGGGSLASGGSAGSGGTMDIPVASKDVLGVVKIGDGLDISADGTISVNAAEAVAAATSGDDEFSEMVKEVLGDENAGDD